VYHADPVVLLRSSVHIHSASSRFVTQVMTLIFYVGKCTLNSHSDVHMHTLLYRDDDMISIASQMSVSNLSTIGFLEDDDDDDMQWWVFKFALRNQGFGVGCDGRGVRDGV